MGILSDDLRMVNHRSTIGQPLVNVPNAAVGPIRRHHVVCLHHLQPLWALHLHLHAARKLHELLHRPPQLQRRRDARLGCGVCCGVTEQRQEAVLGEVGEARWAQVWL